MLQFEKDMRKFPFSSRSSGPQLDCSLSNLALLTIIRLSVIRRVSVLFSLLVTQKLCLPNINLEIHSSEYFTYVIAALYVLFRFDGSE